MITQMKLTDFTNSTVDFEAHKLVSSKVVWVNPKTNFSILAKTKSENLHSKFHEKFSYVISDNGCFKNLKIDNSDSIKMLGERYGGNGIGTNGGGVRCGNIGGYQIKGIGANCLVGEDAPKDHSYGGLDLHGAIIETIYSNVLNSVLPIGAVNIVGLIYTGIDTAVTDGKDCAGALLVRETCVRPAHFLQAPNHKPNKLTKKTIFSDTYRTKIVNNQLQQHFKNDNQYVMFLGKFLSNCANQFAFARILGIGHRTVSPSNIALDGKWLDVPLASFVGGGVNFVAKRSIYDEPLIALEIIDELVHNYSKYNKTILNVQPLVNYYLEQLDAYFDHYFSELLSLPTDCSKGNVEKDWKILLETFHLIIKKSQVVVYTQESLEENSPALEFIIALYMSLHNFDQYIEHTKKHFDIKIKEATKLKCAFSKILQKAFKKSKIQSDFHSFVFSSAIMAIKKSSQLRFFHINNGINKGVEMLCKSPNIAAISSYIDLYNLASVWIFEDSSKNNVTLFKSSDTEVIYNKLAKKFHVKNNEELTKFKSIEIFLNFIDEMAESSLTINDYSFKPSIQNLRCLQSNK